MDPEKVSAVLEWPQPVGLKALQRFFAFANYYRRFIRGFSSVVAPLTSLTKKGADPYYWSSEAQAAFDTLKKLFCSAPILRHVDVTLPFMVEVDASEIRVGAVLSQRSGLQDKTHPCAYFSRRFSPAERNYDVGNRELLAIKLAFQEWRHWLEALEDWQKVLKELWGQVKKNLGVAFQNQKKQADKRRSVEWHFAPGDMDKFLIAMSLILLITVRGCSSLSMCGLETIHEVQQVSEPGDLMLGGIIQLSTYVGYNALSAVERGWAMHLCTDVISQHHHQSTTQVFGGQVEDPEESLMGSSDLFELDDILDDEAADPMWSPSEEINRTPDLLPNITLGYTIYDVCMLEDLAVQSALSILSGVEEPVPNYSCNQKSKVVAFIGHLESSPSLAIAEVSGIYKYPQVVSGRLPKFSPLPVASSPFPALEAWQRSFKDIWHTISYAAMDPIFSDKRLFPYFYRTVPDDRLQHRAIVFLMKQFGWSWVGILVGDDSNQRFSMELYKEIIQSGICVAFMETIKRDEALEKEKNLHIMRKTSCSVLIFLGNSKDVFYLETILFEKHSLRKVIILPTMRFSHRITMVINQSLVFSPPRRDIPGLREYLLSAGPLKYKHVQLMYWIWIRYLECFVGIFNERCRPCTEKDCLSQVDSSVYDVNDFSYTFSIYSAVYAVAHALHDLLSYEENSQLQSFGTSHHPWKLHRYLKSLLFNTTGGDLIHFDEKGSVPAHFSVFNFIIFPNETMKKLQVGYFAEGPDGLQFLRTDKAIHWDPRFNQIPSSVCTPSCLPGYRKVPQEGQQRCCYYCVPCAEGEISNQTDMEKCMKCPEDHWSNEQGVICIARPVEFLSFGDGLAACFLVFSLLLCFSAVVVLVIFIVYKDTAIVKSSNRNLSFILLLSLVFSFLCPLLFIGQPTKISCLLRHVAFGNIFTLAVSSILAKTITVLLAFNTIKPDRRMSCILGKYFFTSVLILGSFGQTMICIFWLTFSPPFPEYNTQVEVGKIILQCNEGSVTMFYTVIGYMGCLAMISFIVAFLVRNLPDAFNEAQYITFSMLVFCSVWISFIPAYLSTKGKYMVAVEIFCILASSAGLLGCIFIPKCYIILMRPELNTKTGIMGRKTFSKT
ncbi:vomeronasal type-2 receptor 26-like [Hyperolius riggenbachi]|uniref:vomeronasal type-2 receptor 26-like n=1 Tax=Hyperolius riggenbachi TaxID=752182 RepID=UPI0035A32500